MKKKIEEIVVEVVRQFAKENGLGSLKNPDGSTVLFGTESIIDSLGLVTIIVEIEARVFDELGLSLSLADEKAMSQKNSPFRTIDSLTNYITTII